MKDTHLIIALYRALDRYGSAIMPDNDEARGGRKSAHHEERRRSSGWVSDAEIETSQSPNTYPRLTRRGIRMRCQALSSEQGSPVQAIENGTGGLSTWVLVVPPGNAQKAGARGKDVGAQHRSPSQSDAAGQGKAAPARRATAGAAAGSEEEVTADDRVQNDAAQDDAERDNAERDETERDETEPGNVSRDDRADDATADDATADDDTSEDDTVAHRHEVSDKAVPA